MRRALRRRHLLHACLRCTRSTAILDYGQQLKDLGADSICHQGHGGHAHALSHRAHGQGVQRRDRPAACTSTATTSAAWLPPTSSRPPKRAPRSPTRASAPLAFGNSQPAVEMVVAALAGEPLRHRARPRPAVRDRRVLGGGAQARPLQARRLLAHPHAGVLASGPGRHDEQPGVPSSRARTPPTACPRSWRRSPRSAPRLAIRRWSRRCPRSWAPRPCSTCSPASAGASSPRR